MIPGFVGADTAALSAGSVDLVDVGRDLAALGPHLRHLGLACAGAGPDLLAAPLAEFGVAVSAFARQAGEQVAAVGWLGSHLATDLDVAAGGADAWVSP